MKQLKLDGTRFIEQYWQKKPGIFRNVFKENQDILDEHDLAGLAQEEELDSRIIRQFEGKWQYDQGPFEDYTPLCKGKWSLLVQGVENVLPDAQRLLDEFNFIPSWRIDDLMVSFSVPGAGVGPHLDQYDVFIIQGKGSRRWQIGLPGEFDEVVPHHCIRQISHFTPVIDEVLHPGDMIYIPPGHPHNGTATEDCINYSVGFRAATQTELLSHFCDHLIDYEGGQTRYEDPELKVREHASELKRDEMEKVRQLLLDAVNGPEFEHWLGSRLTFPGKYIHEDSDTIYDADEIMQLVNNGATFYKTPGLRYLHYEVISPDGELQETKQKLTVFVNLEAYEFSLDDQKTVINLLNQPEWRNKSKKTFKNCSHFIRNLSKLVNKGYWTVDK